MLLGKCPYCDDGEIEVRKKEVRRKKVELYACSNASWTTEDGEFFELTSTSKCGFKIWQNALGRYGHWLKHSEIRELLLNGEVEIKLKTQKRFGLKNENRKDYYKTAILDSEYGIKILF